MEFPQRFEIPIRYIQAHYEPDDRLCVALIKRHGEQSAIRQEFMEAREICKPKYQARPEGRQCPRRRHICYVELGGRNLIPFDASSEFARTRFC